jgi:hypothetical protein
MKKIRTALAAVAMAGMLAACGSSDDSGSGDDGVASLGSTTTSPDGDEQTTETSVDPQEAMLAYSQCMRDEGIDMPDPVFSEDGTGGGMVISREASGEDDKGPMFDIDSEEFQAAEEKCSPIMDEAIGSIEVDPEQQAEMREQMLEYAQCMRYQGIDFPDPEFGDNGRVTMGMGQEGEPPTDAEMEAMDAANEVCAKDGGPIAMGAAPAGPAGGQED